ncbi:MAG: aminotransferase class V-fold PLP-dependent enzyme [Burkholderiaceae bacterium]
MHAPLECQRDQFDLDPDHVWLNSAYMGPLPRATVQAGQRALQARAFPAGITPADFFEPAERTRRLLAGLVNADAEQVAFIPTAAYGTAIVARQLSPVAGANVVMLGDQFPSNVYPWRRWREHGVQMRMVAAPPPGADRLARWHEALLAAIDERTMLASIEQAHWTDGSLFDLVRIGAHCRHHDVPLAIDATQTVGAMPLDVAAVRPDALIVHSYKSMLSNYGLGFAVLGGRFANGEPLEESWLMRAGSEDFSALVDYQDDYAAGMRRFDTSLRANPMLIAMLEASATLLQQWQPARIRDYLLRIERPFVARLRDAGFGVADEGERAANLFGLRLPQGLDAQACRAALAARNIHVSVRGASVRVAPHVYNDEADLMRLADVLEGMV